MRGVHTREAAMKKTGKPALRNWTAANNPLLRKGGAHRKSRKAERKCAKDELRRDTRRGSDSSPIGQPVHELQA